MQKNTRITLKERLGQTLAPSPLAPLPFFPSCRRRMRRHASLLARGALRSYAVMELGHRRRPRRLLSGDLATVLRGQLRSKWVVTSAQILPSVVGDDSGASRRLLGGGNGDAAATSATRGGAAVGQGWCGYDLQPHGWRRVSSPLSSSISATVALAHMHVG